MSFLRYQEIYQVGDASPSDKQSIERAQPYDRALTHRLDESPVGYSWQVALQQSPLPLQMNTQPYKIFLKKSPTIFVHITLIP